MKNQHSFSFTKKIALVCLLCAVTFFMYSCSKPKLPSEDIKLTTKTLTHDGVTRTYHIYLPKNLNTTNKVPLVLALHGGAGTGISLNKWVTANTLTKAAAAKGVILVFPEGIKKRWNSGRPEIIPQGEVAYDDVGFLSQLIDTMIADYNIDDKRVYSTGISNGGFMSIRLALEISDKIAAIAPVTAQIPKVHEGKQPQFPISALFINGTADPLVPYEGGDIQLVFGMGPTRGEILSTDESVAHFVAVNQCSTSPTSVSTIDALDDDTAITISSYTGGQNNTEVVLVKVEGGGHTWPRGTQYMKPERVGVVSKELNASEFILDFLLRNAKN